jgi:hypothetical protein
MTIELPRRLSPPAKPGELLKRPAAPERISPEKGKSPDYLALVRLLPCLYCGQEPAGEAAHVRLASAAFGKSSGLGKKPDDCWALPLCASDHRNARHAQHNRNESEFWQSLGINPLLAASQLWEARGDFTRMVSIVHVVIASRSLIKP